MIARLLVCTAFVGFCFALHPCCISKKFYGKIKIVTTSLKNGSSMPILTDNMLMIDYDADRMMDREMGTIYTDDGMKQTTYNYSVINDHMNNKRYTLSESGCTVEMIEPDSMTPHCVPPTLMWDAAYTMGSGTESVRVNSWRGMYEGFVWSIQTSVNDCTPLSLSRYGMDKDGTMMSEFVLYADMTQYTVSSPDPFIIPAMCMTAGMPVG